MVYQIKGYYTTCLPAFDIVIFSEAISRFWYEWNLNPFVNVRQIKIFNDHVDFIQLLFAPIHALFGYKTLTIIFIPYSAIALAAVVLYKKFKLHINDVAFALTLLLCHRGVAGELSYPIHPILWSMPLLLIFVRNVMDDRIKAATICAFILLLFKETYAFALLGLGSGYLAFFFKFRDKKYLTSGLITFLGAVLYLVWYFAIRPNVMGDEVYDYSGEHAGKLVKYGIIGFIKVWLSKFDYKVFFTTFIPLVSLFIIFFKKLKLQKEAVLILFWMAPFLALHMYTNFFFHWHAVPFATVLIALFLTQIELEKIERKWRIATVAFFLIFSSFLHVRAARFVFLNYSKTCEISDIKMSGVKMVREFIKSQPDNTFFLMTSGLVPWSLHPKYQFQVWGEYMSKRTDYDYIIFEKGNKGIHPVVMDSAIVEASEKCHGSEVILNNDYLFMAKGPFSNECLSVKFE